MFDQAKKRILSVEESGWIERATRDIQTSNSAIIDLAGVLADVAELADVEGLDPHIKNDLCRHGAQALAFTIKALGLTIAEKRAYIDDVLSGIVAAEMHARRQAVDLICPSVPVSP